MVLHRSNFEIPARFTFQPFVADWQLTRVEIVEWAHEPKLSKMALGPIEDNSEKCWLRIRIEVPDRHNLVRSMLDLDPAYPALVDRKTIPPDVLQAHENYSNTPDVSGRSFQVLICQKPEFKDRLWELTPGDVTKSAWIMRDEFLNLTEDSEFGWDWSARRFLNKWGLWELGTGFVKVWDSATYQNLVALATLFTRERTDTPGFTVVMPHLLKEQQARYRKALLPSNGRAWLRSHPLNLSTADKYPFFRVNKSYCSDAIETTITIDHLAERKFGICKRCHKVFEKETNHEKNYCSKACINAATVQRWRERQREMAKKGAKRNAKG